MSRVTTSEVVLGQPDPAPEPEQAPAPTTRKPSKSDAAKADVVKETEETP